MGSTANFGGYFSVGHIVLDFNFKQVLFWTDSVGCTLLGMSLYVALCWTVKDILCWALRTMDCVGQFKYPDGIFPNNGKCWTLIEERKVLDIDWEMESVGQ